VSSLKIASLSSKFAKRLHILPRSIAHPRIELRHVFELLTSSAIDQKVPNLKIGQCAHISPKLFKLSHREYVFLCIAPVAARIRANRSAWAGNTKSCRGRERYAALSLTARIFGRGSRDSLREELAPQYDEQAHHIQVTAARGMTPERCLHVIDSAAEALNIHYSCVKGAALTRTGIIPLGLRGACDIDILLSEQDAPRLHSTRPCPMCDSRCTNAK